MFNRFKIPYLRTFAIFMMACLSVTAYASADDYDDDIYYSPSKAKEKKAKEEARRAQREAELRKQYEEAMAASYSSGSSMPLGVDADTYNRYGNFLVGDSEAVPGDTAAGDFAYTRRIERFYNPDVVTSSGDSTLIREYYYTQAAPSNDVNIYVVGGIYDPMVNYSSWAWRFGLPSYMWGAYSPYYYGWGYSPSWMPGWGWSLAWGWDWGWNWGWGGPWYPGCYPPHPGHHPNWGNHHAWRPTSPGASSTHRPVYSGTGAGNRRPSTNGAGRPGNGGRYNFENSYTPSGDIRPGNSGRGRVNGNYRPSTGSGSGSNRYTPSTGSTSRPSSTGSNNSSSRRGRSNYNNSNNNSSSNSYRSSGSSSGSYRSSGSFGGGSRGGFGGGSGAGSGGRGRR